jgi:hypothetical protein
MTTQISPTEILKNVRVAAPCHASWDAMDGDDRTRFCFSCKLNVYNLSDMTADEAARLVQETEGRLCVRYYQRRDGTVMTRNCPVGVSALQKRVATMITSAAALCLVMVAAAKVYERSGGTVEVGVSPFQRAKDQARKMPVIGPIVEKLDPQRHVIVGMMKMPPVVYRPNGLIGNGKP